MRTSIAPPHTQPAPRRAGNGAGPGRAGLFVKDPGWAAGRGLPAALDGAVRELFEAENARTERVLADLAPLRRAVFDEMRSRVQDTPQEVLIPPYLYYLRFPAHRQYPLFLRRPAKTGGPEEMLVDISRLAGRRPYFHVGALQPSPDHRWLACTYDARGAGFYDLTIMALPARPDGRAAPSPQAGRPTRWRRLDGSRSGARDTSNAVWANDSRFLFYTVLDDRHRPCAVYRHRIDGDPADDVLVFEEKDPGYFVSLGRTESGAFITITVHNYTTTEVRVLPADRPTETPRLVWPRWPGRRYEVRHRGRSFVILTNADGCEDYKIVRVPVGDCGLDEAQVLVAHRPGRRIETFRVYREFLAWQARENGRSRIVAKRFSDGGESVVDPGPGDAEIELLDAPFASRSIVYRTSGLATPPVVMRRAVRSGRERLVSPQGRGPSVPRDAYVVERFEARASDGERVPVSVLRRQETTRDGSGVGAAAAVLYAYGSYGRVMPPTFTANSSASVPFWDRLSLVDRGIVHAIAHVRGGADKGASWHRQGSGEHKETMLSDYLCVAHELVARGIAKTGRIVAHGDSAGGLLVASAVNREPSLFGALVAEVPVLDLAGTLADPDLPLTLLEWAEWGNPLADAGAAERIRRCCPFETLSEQTYPPTFVTAGIADWMVPWWIPANWVAKLRSLTGNGNDVLLRMNLSAGHAGPSGRLDKLAEVAETYAYIIHVCERSRRRRPAVTR